MKNVGKTAITKQISIILALALLVGELVFVLPKEGLANIFAASGEAVSGSDISVSGGDISDLENSSDAVVSEGDIAIISDETSAEIIASGTCGDNLTWELDSEGTLTISGTGAMTDWASNSSVPWYDCRANITSVIINHGISNIGSWAFNGQYNTTSIVIPNSVTSIGDNAIYGCSKIVSIEIPESVMHIGNGAFQYCFLLSDVIIPNSVTNIGNEAFYYCESLKKVTIPNSVTNFGNKIFYHCTSLTEATLPEGIRSVGKEMFYECISLINVYVPDSVTSIGEYAFYKCQKLTNFSIPPLVSSIGKYAFSDCDSIKTFTIPNNVNRISAYTFSSCDTLKTINFPDGLISIEEGAFKGCNSIVSIIIPEGVTKISAYAFSFCDSLESVEIPSSVISIEPFLAFNGRSLTQINVSENNNIYSSVDGVLFNKDKTTLVCYPSGRAGHYSIPYGVENISSHAFRENDELTSIEMPNTITSIGDNAFANCSKLKNIKMSESLCIIGKGAFYFCDIESIVIPNGVTEIMANTFEWCTSLEEIIFPNTLTKIGDYAFHHCDSLANIIFPESLNWISYRAFSHCSELRSIIIPANVTYIGAYAFANTCYDSVTILSSVVDIIDTKETIVAMTIYGYSGSTAEEYANKYNRTFVALSEYTEVSSGTCGDNLTWELNSEGTLTISGEGEMTNYEGNHAPWYSYRNEITSVILCNGVTSVGGWAFLHCENLKSVSIPESVVVIGDAGFKCCYSLESIILPESLTKIDDHAFMECDSLKSIIIPNNVTSIGIWAFCGCDSLTDIVLGNKVSRIVEYVFSDCTSLKTIDLPPSVYYVSCHAFDGCDSLSKIVINDPTCTLYVLFTAHPIPSHTTIYGYSGSTAEAYANEYGRIFVALQEDIISEADNYIVEEVKKYTSQEMCDLYLAIMNSDASYEVKFKVLNEFFEDYGITDVREGTKFLSDTTSHRHSYLYLTTDEIYCAYNFYEWLYTTPKGLAARSALYADGLIFNYEAFSAFDLSTYTENDYPGVKKNKAMLKQFMSYEDPQNAITQTLEYAKLSADYLEKIIQLNQIEVNDSIKELLHKINNSKSSEKIDEYVDVLVNDYIMPAIKANDSTEIHLDGKQFGKALGYASDVISITGAVAEDITLLINLSNEIAMYKKYEGFLRTIYECTDVSFEMRLAAFSLLDEIENGYMNRIRSLLGEFVTFTSGKLIGDAKLLKKAIGENGATLGDALATLKLGIFISNIVIDTGDFVKQAAYTQGYAELSTLYCLKLKEDKAAFLASPTAENAWKFYEDYNLLWNLRYQGEEQYLRMNEVKAFIFAKIKLKDYDLKEEIVNDTRAHLLTCRFDLSSDIEIPESVQYISKTVVNCPVDVEVYSPNGTLIATLKDGVESDITNEYGRFAVVYQPYSGEYAKVICNATNDTLRIKAIAVGDGFVDVAFANNADNSYVYSFDNVEVNTGDVIEFTTNISASSEYTIDVTGNGIVDNIGVFDVHDEETYVQVQEISADTTTINMAVGETKNIDVVITPSNATNSFVAWLSSDESIVTVDNGKITAVGAGTANLYAYAIDNSSLLIEFEIEVTDEIIIDIAKLILSPEDTATIKVDTESSVEWASSDSRIATVDANGVVTAHTLGTAVITASAGAASASCTVEVVPPISLTAMGGSVRIVEPYGLRFGIQLKKDAAYKQYKDIIVSYGTLIIPKKTLGDAPLTFDVEKAMDVPAVNIYSEDSTQLTYTGVLVGIPKSSFYADIVGRGYLKYLDIDGNEKVLYTDEIVRSYYQVASSAHTRYGNMTDRNATEQAVYEKLDALLKEMA